MKVCIAEKPSVAKEIANILGAKIKKDGYFEGNGYRVTWTFGHLCTLKTPDEYTPKWKKWNLNTLPMVPERFEIKLIRNKGVSKQFKIIKSLIDNCTEVINCGDAGIEGELIQRWVLKKAACKKTIKRLWISSLTEEAIREGFKKLKDASDYDLLYAAGNARAIGDWLLGMNASRLYTLKYANGKGVLSIGRVQTPTLALIVQRHIEIEHFTPERYWELKTIYRDVLFSANGQRFKKKNEVEKIVEIIKNSNFTVTSFTRKKGKEQPPPLFDLTSLQVECNNKFGFTADNTLKIVQKLYENKYITYPRVDTKFLPWDVYPKIPGILKGLKSYEEIVEPLLKNSIRKSKKVFDDKKITDHHAIIPTGVHAHKMTPQDEKVYDTLTRRFIAAFYPDCIVSITIVLGEVKDVKFKAKGKQIIEDGWRVVYPKQEKKDDTKEAQIIPVFEKGETGHHKPEIHGKETKPPKPYTEATLLRAMETAGKQVDDEELRHLMKENGIGRPSTRGNIIETLFKRNYTVRAKKNILPTGTGIQLIGTIESELLKSVELTGIWEKKLRQIERGEFDAGVFLDEMKNMISVLVCDVKKESGKTITVEERKYKKRKFTNNKKNEAKTKPGKTTAQNTIINCPKCHKGRIIKGKAAYGCSEFRSGCDFRVNFTIQGKRLSEKQVFDLIQKGKTSELSGFKSNSNKVKGQLILNENSISFKPSTDDQKYAKNKTIEGTRVKTKLVCPMCGQGYMIKGKAAYGCSRYREGCKFIISFDELSKHNSNVLTMELLEEISMNLDS